MSDPYDEVLEDMKCPKCGATGMSPNGTGWYECPVCGHDGGIEGYE